MAVAKWKAEKDGRDIQSELWDASGETRPEQEPPAECLMLNGAPVDDFNVPAIVTLFPIEDYLSHLFRIGKLTALGISPRDAAPRELSLAEWKELEIAYGGNPPRLNVWRAGKVRTGDGDYGNVCVSREDALKKFPVEPPVTSEVNDESVSPSEALKLATPEAIRLAARSVYAKAAKNSEPPPDKHSATQSIQALLKEKKLTAPCRRIGPVLNENLRVNAESAASAAGTSQLRNRTRKSDT